MILYIGLNYTLLWEGRERVFDSLRNSSHSQYALGEDRNYEPIAICGRILRNRRLACGCISSAGVSQPTISLFHRLYPPEY